VLATATVLKAIDRHRAASAASAATAAAAALPAALSVGGGGGGGACSAHASSGVQGSVMRASCNRK
jgi:hypothetical protein